MTASRRAGSPTAFWNNVAVGAAGTSTPVYLPRGVEQIAIYATVSGATTLTLEAAHHGALTAEGNEPSQNNPPSTFYSVQYINTAVQLVFAGAGSIANIVPDFEPVWIRLRSAGAVTITAGFEVTGD